MKAELSMKAVLYLIAGLHVIIALLNFFLWINVPKSMMAGSTALILLILTRANLDLMWSTRKKPVLQNIVTQRVVLMHPKYVPLMIFAVGVDIWGFALQFRD